MLLRNKATVSSSLCSRSAQESKVISNTTLQLISLDLKLTNRSLITEWLGIPAESLSLHFGFSLTGRIRHYGRVGISCSTANPRSFIKMCSKTSATFDLWGTPFITCSHPSIGLFTSLFLVYEQILYSKQKAHRSPILWWCSALYSFWCGNLSKGFLSFLLLHFLV